jgi:hypothetical protein
MGLLLSVLRFIVEPFTPFTIAVFREFKRTGDVNFSTRSAGKHIIARQIRAFHKTPPLIRYYSI